MRLTDSYKPAAREADSDPQEASALTEEVQEGQSKDMHTWGCGCLEACWSTVAFLFLCSSPFCNMRYVTISEIGKESLPLVATVIKSQYLSVCLI